MTFYYKPKQRVVLSRDELNSLEGNKVLASFERWNQ